MMKSASFIMLFLSLLFFSIDLSTSRAEFPFFNNFILEKGSSYLTEFFLVMLGIAASEVFYDDL